MRAAARHRRTSTPSGAQARRRCAQNRTLRRYTITACIRCGGESRPRHGAPAAKRYGGRRGLTRYGEPFTFGLKRKTARRVSPYAAKAGEVRQARRSHGSGLPFTEQPGFIRRPCAAAVLFSGSCPDVSLRRGVRASKPRYHRAAPPCRKVPMGPAAAFAVYLPRPSARSSVGGAAGGFSVCMPSR